MEELNWDGLTEKQRRFIDYYIQTGNAAEACRLAGYRGNNSNNLGSENLAKLGRYIEAKMKAKNHERIASQDEVLEFLTKTMRNTEKDAFGMDASLQDRIKCAELLGKRYGAFVDKKDITSSGITIKLVDDVHE